MGDPLEFGGLHSLPLCLLSRLPLLLLFQEVCDAEVRYALLFVLELLEVEDLGCACGVDGLVDNSFLVGVGVAGFRCVWFKSLPSYVYLQAENNTSFWIKHVIKFLFLRLQPK